MMMRRCVVVLICLLPGILSAGQYHVTVNGTTNGAGTEGSPWSIDRGFDIDASPHPAGGDTLWIHGGVYTKTSGIFDIELAGTSDALPVIVRNWNNEHVQLVSATSHGPFDAGETGNEEWTALLRGDYLWVWGLDISASTTDAGDASNIVMLGYRSKLINNYIHDGQAVGVTSQQMQGAEVYGNVINYNGREQVADEGVGYGMYIQNVITNLEAKYTVDNIIAYNWGWNWQAYTEAGTNDSLVFIGNAVYGAGLFWQRDYPTTRTWGVQFVYQGPADRARWFQMRDNHLYQAQSLISTSSGGNYFGNYGAGPVTIMTMTGNILAGTRDVVAFSNVSPPNTVTGNVIVGPNDIQAGYPSNTFLSSWPSARPDDIFVRKNKYEANRGHIIAWNWNESATISVNPNAGGTILNSGDTYVVKDGLNPWGANVASGTWTSGTITIPMTGLTAAMPVWPDTNEIPIPLHGWRKVRGDEYFEGQTPPHTAPRFAAFILIGGNEAAAEDTLPSVTTNAATSVGSSTATVNGSVDANSSSTTVRFVRGTVSGTYTDSTTAAQSPVTGTDPTAVSAALSSLSPGTTYYFRAAGVNAAGYVRGSELNFTTTAAPVTVKRWWNLRAR